MDLKRIKNEDISIDTGSIHDFYAKRAIDKVAIDVDAPVVLCADKAPEKIEYWTKYEIENRLPLFKLDNSCKVLELGFGTGRIAKYLTDTAELYVGIDYVKEFVELAKQRNDIKKNDHTYFLNASLQEFVNKEVELPINTKFNRFIISGGVLMYINEEMLKDCISKLVAFLDEKCIIYVSEPIALSERLTLNKFYSDNLDSEYSAIYRTISEYNQIFKPLYDNGFRLTIEEEFFTDDIKNQKETKQWLFILER